MLWLSVWLRFWYGEYVFTSCCGLCCFWKLKCGGLLTCGDLSLAFFGLVLYFTEKLHHLIPEGQKSPPGVQSQSGNSCKTAVLDLEWGPDVHTEMW